MVDVFISYSRADQEKVAMLARMIASEGYQVWWDADLPPHMSYGDVITAKIGAAKAAVVVWSDTAAKSEWVRAEADVARNQKKLIQTSLDDVMPPLPFNQIQCAAIGDWNGESDHRGWNKVKESLVALCGPRGEAAAPPETPAPPPASPTPRASPPASASVPASRPSTPKTASKKKRKVPSSPSSTGGASPTAPAQPKASLGAPVIIGLGCGGLAIVTLFLLVVAALMEDTGDYSDFDMADTDGYVTPPPDTPTGSIEPVPPTIDPAPLVNPEMGQMPVFVVATVQDPDGYTNVRAGPSADSAIIAQVMVGQPFITYQQDTSWWNVLLEDGTEGYIYSDRIYVIGTP